MPNTKCWVCKTPFGPSVKCEEHHIIPRAYGGTDGPLVSLCDSHHSMVHEIALKLWTRKSFNQLLDNNSEVNERLLYLANVAYNSRVATDKDPNKQTLLLIPDVKGELLSNIKTLQKIYPVSKTKIVALAIQKLYSNHFSE